MSTRILMYMTYFFWNNALPNYHITCMETDATNRCDSVAGFNDKNGMQTN